MILYKTILGSLYTNKIFNNELILYFSVNITSHLHNIFYIILLNH